MFLIAICNSNGYSQKNESSNITNTTKNTNQNITKDIIFSGSTNVSKESEKYKSFKRFESTPPPIVIDKESILSDYDKKTEKLKENLDRFESTLPPSKKFMFNSSNIFNNNLTQSSNSNLSKTNSIDLFKVSKIVLDNPIDKDKDNRSGESNNQILKWKGLDIAEAAKNEG
jgi:hypothetical protein